MTRLAPLLNGAIGSALPEPKQRRARTWLRRIIAAVREYHRIQSNYDLLIEMPDHLLRDVGLNRGQLVQKRFDHRHKIFWIIGS